MHDTMGLLISLTSHPLSYISNEHIKDTNLHSFPLCMRYQSHLLRTHSLFSMALPQMLPVLTILLTLLTSSSGTMTISCYKSLFVFGDAYNDVGNYIHIDQSLNIDRLPYGMTYFGRPTGRFCDGRIIPDFLAEAFGLPFPPPYLGLATSGQDVRQGVNFAVAGAAVLDPSFFIERGYENVWNYTLSLQMRWFKDLLPSLCSSESECRDYMGRALFSLGEIGINDFNYPLMRGRDPAEFQSYIPYVVDALISTINELIDLGARTVVVPGHFPNGCIPQHLTNYYPVMMKDDYDPVTGCLKKLNQLSELYDLQLQDALDWLHKRNPHATIIYANLYKASMMLIESPEKFGFNKPALRVCCGGGGPYNYNESALCGSPGATACDDPSRAVFWTGYQFTEAAYKFMARSILEGPNAVPPIAHACQQMLPVLTILLTLLASSSGTMTTSCYKSLFVFGDSYSDVGNYIYTDQSLNIDRLPYGMTYFGRPTGRFCDGRIIPDFLAEAFGLPFPPPYLDLATSRQDVRQGVNFAVGGATVLDLSFFVERGYDQYPWNHSLSLQMRWFKDLLPSLCSSESECRDFMGRALFSLGEIGANDFNAPLLSGRAPTEFQSYIPNVVDALSSTINELIELGARTVVVPGIVPTGCIPQHLTLYYPIAMKDNYDPVTGCLKKLNQLSELYDLHLQDALDRLRERNPHATIIYANLYKASIMLIEAPEKFGFNKPALRVCCGGGGPYNFNASAKCGLPGATACDDPSRAVFWTEYHFTEAAYKFIARSILEGPNAVPPIAHACQQIMKHVDRDLMLNVY